MSAPYILVVDDEPDICRLVKEILEDEDYEVGTAEHGASARRALRERRPDLILLDLAMPGIDGYAVLRQIRQREETAGTPRMPIILLTAYVKSAFKDEELLQQVNGVITKPVTTQKLEVELTAILEEKA